MGKKEEKINLKIPSLPSIDKIIHEPARLDILAVLYVIKESDFIFLKNQTGMTWGNLSSHLSKLEDAGYIRVKKEISNKKTKTRINLTDEGRSAFREYRKKIDDFLKKFPEYQKVLKMYEEKMEELGIAPYNIRDNSKWCEFCQGIGLINGRKCPVCEGSGKLTSN